MRVSQDKFARKMQIIETMCLDVEAILERLKEVYRLASDADLARFLDMTSSGVSTWKRRGSLDLSFIVEKCLATPTADLKMVNLHWLIAGQEPAALETIQSIVVKEIVRQTPGILQEVVSSVVEKLKNEELVLEVKVESTLRSKIPQPRRSK